MKVYSQTEISWIRLDRWTTDSAFFVVRSSWLVGNEFVVRRGRPKGRPAVIFDHSSFGMMVCFYEPRTTAFFADSDAAYRRDRLMIVLRPSVIRHKFRLYPRFTAGRPLGVPYDIAIQAMEMNAAHKKIRPSAWCVGADLVRRPA